MSLPKRPAANVHRLFRTVLFRTKVIDASVGMFLGLIALAMMLYRGGTWWDPQRSGHSFWENFLCDLLHRRTLGGAPNLAGSRIAAGAITLLAIGLLTAFSLSPEIIPSRKSLGKKLAWLGSIGSVFVLLPVLAPSDRFPGLHAVAVTVGGLPALLAFALLVGAILIEPATSRSLRATSLGLLVLAVVAMALYVWTAFLHGPSLRILPSIERVANVMLLVWLLLVAHFVRLRLVAAYVTMAKRRQT